MTYSTFFEIGGHIIENQMDPGGRPPATSIKTVSKQTGVPAPLLRQGSREIQKSTGYDVARAAQAPGRLRRAKWAFGVAGTLALADGPLPIGDALAIAFLGSYGVYETVSAVQDIRQ